LSDEKHGHPAGKENESKIKGFGEETELVGTAFATPLIMYQTRHYAHVSEEEASACFA